MQLTNIPHDVNEDSLVYRFYLQKVYDIFSVGGK